MRSPGRTPRPASSRRGALTATATTCRTCLPPVSGTSTAAGNRRYSTFNQDLNGDGQIGIPKVVIQTDGSTALTQVGNNFFLNNAGSGAGPELQYKGAAVTAGEFGTFTPIGVVQTASGYDIAWKDTATGLFTAWSVDSNGNYLSNLFAPVSGTSTVLESLETTFNQDLNGDGVIGIPKVVIQTDGSTALTQVGNNYFLNNTGSGSGPELQYGGAPVTVGEFGYGHGTFTPIGAVQVAGGGYDIVRKDAADRSLHGVERRQQRQLPVEPVCPRVGNQPGAGNAGDHLQPGSQRRWPNRHSESRDPGSTA